jgi:hypothetical protein
MKRKRVKETQRKKSMDESWRRLLIIRTELAKHEQNKKGSIEILSGMRC